MIREIKGKILLQFDEVEVNSGGFSAHKYRVMLALVASTLEAESNLEAEQMSAQEAVDGFEIWVETFQAVL